MYNPKDLRGHYFLSIFSTGFATLLLGFLHPYLIVLMAYDYYLLFGFTRVLNQTTWAILLDSSKRHIYLNKLNFLGYETKF